MIGGVALRVTSPVLVGRVAEAAQLWAAFERAVAGSPATVVVAGEAGVGKTRLVSELLARARAHGALTLVGGCLDVGEGVVAYAPMVEALRALGELLGPEELERVLAGARPALARLVPELGAPVASVSSRGGSVGAEATGVLEPGRLFELLLGVLHRLAERGAVLLVVEDLHWADRSTRNLLGFLVRNLRGGVALVLTYRSDELHRRHPLRGFLAELERSGRVERLELGRLGRRELGELLAGILGEPPAPALVDEILARSEGNPFFAEELLAARVGGVGGSAELLPVQRPPLHAASAHALAARIEGEGGAGAAELGRLAYHWYAAHDLGRALLASVQAGQAAEAAFALAEAAGHYERALELWEQAPEAAANSPLDPSSLLQRAAQAASRVGEGARAVALINQAPAVPGGRLPGRRAAGRRRAGVWACAARLGPGRQAPADRQGLPGAATGGCDHLL